MENENARPGDRLYHQPELIGADWMYWIETVGEGIEEYGPFRNLEAATVSFRQRLRSGHGPVDADNG